MGEVPMPIIQEYTLEILRIIISQHLCQLEESGQSIRREKCISSAMGRERTQLGEDEALFTYKCSIYATRFRHTL